MHPRLVECATARSIGHVVNGGEPDAEPVPASVWGDHPFGQDEVGHDTFAQVMRGTQQSLMIVFVVGIVVDRSSAWSIGALSGFFRGWIDTVLMRITDIVIIIPLLVLTAVLGQTYGNSGSFVLAIVLGSGILDGPGPTGARRRARPARA